ncbi:MAG: hypothetical protein KC591_18240 [Gemmatimonadetes bacterium]|nr:hypothetical protein [Gemmatimonadota bacterium]
MSEASERRIARGVEASLKVALIIGLGILTWKLFAMLAHVGIAWWKGAPAAALFVLAAAWAARGVLATFRGEDRARTGFRRGERDSER